MSGNVNCETIKTRSQRIKEVYLGNVRWHLGSSWSWSYGSWIYKYQCNQYLSYQSCELESHSGGCTRYNIMWYICQWLAAGRWFSSGTPVSSTNKTDHHDITNILLKVTLNTKALTISLITLLNSALLQGY